MIAYASITGTRRNIAIIEQAKWRWFMGPFYARPNYRPYALDNGAWSCYQQGKPFDHAAFGRLLDKYAANADFIILPDVVAGGRASFELTLRYLERLRGARLLLIAVQNGMTEADVRPFLGPRVGIFIGGDTAYKLGHGPAWGKVAQEVGCYLHVGRVNSAKRIRFCSRIGADSFDGTSASMYASTLPALKRAASYPSLLRPRTRTP